MIECGDYGKASRLCANHPLRNTLDRFELALADDILAHSLHIDLFFFSKVHPIPAQPSRFGLNIYKYNSKSHTSGSGRSRVPISLVASIEHCPIIC